MKQHFLSLCAWFLTMLCMANVQAQNESNIWYFGENAGLDFSSGSPVTLTQGMLKTTEGVATISDESGKLLFYTDGVTLWDRNHAPMPNGSGLKGDPSSTQSAVAVLQPGSKTRYFLFTVDVNHDPDGFCYNVVDMSLNNGLGDIVEKNVSIITPVTERVTAVKHRNNRDFWVITHGWDNNNFYAYQLTDKGLNRTAVVSSAGTVHDSSTDNAIGYLKSSPDGSQLAIAIKGIHVVELFDFDNETGQVSNPIKLSFENGSLPYGIEFSKNGSLLYVSLGGGKQVWQFNLQAGSNEAIVQSGLVVGRTDGWCGALQIARDGKIYVSPYMMGKLDVIHEPDKVGEACRFEKGAIDLLGKKCTLGFPTFVQSYFTQRIFEGGDQVTNFSEAKVVSVGKAFVLTNIYFDTDKFDLKPNSFAELDKLVTLLKNNAHYSIVVSGHTDNVGNKSYNLKLSDNRSKAVAAYLVKKGIAESRIQTAGYGSVQPLATNETAEGRQRNRRVEFVLNE